MSLVWIPLPFLVWSRLKWSFSLCSMQICIWLLFLAFVFFLICCLYIFFSKVPVKDFGSFLNQVVFSYSFFFILISWRLITLQYCSGFCHTLTWISLGYTCIPHPDPPSHLPLHTILLGLLDSVGEGEGGMFRENSIETCILSRVKQITSPGLMHETSALTWCTAFGYFLSKNLHDLLGKNQGMRW